MSELTRRLGPIRQNGYVVTDMDAALQHWTEVLGVGPFYYVDSVALDWFRYRGAEQSPEMSIALANSGALQIELICQRDQTPTTYLEFLDHGGPGLQHVAYWSTDFQTDYDAMVAAGRVLGQEGQIGGPQGRFAYFDSVGHRGTVLELSDISGPKGQFFEHIHRASIDWDGTRPVRAIT